MAPPVSDDLRRADEAEARPTPSEEAQAPDRRSLWRVRRDHAVWL